MAITRIKQLPDDVVTAGKIEGSTVINADVSPSAAIAQSKILNLTTNISSLCSSATAASTTLTAACAQNSVNNFNIGLLGFKMAVNENLTVFNLIDGVVDEFHDESGTDEGEGTNDNYCASSDFYSNISGGSVQSSVIVSEPFAAGSVPTTSRIVVFEEDVETPTLNTDVIASISRDGGTTFTTATLSDSGYITGSSGQRILTDQATISGQPSGQSMRWKLALANKKVKIHGVSLSWT